MFLGKLILIIRSFFQAVALPITNTEIIEGVSGNGNGISSKIQIVNFVTWMQVKHENASILKRIAPTGYFVSQMIDAICKNKDV